MLKHVAGPWEVAGAGLDLVLRDGTTIKAQYDGLFGSEVQQHTFGAKASVKF